MLKTFHLFCSQQHIVYQEVQLFLHRESTTRGEQFETTTLHHFCRQTQTKKTSVAHVDAVVVPIARGFLVWIPIWNFLCRVCMFSPCAQELLQPQSEGMLSRLIGDSESLVGGSVSMTSCLFGSIGPVTDWWPQKGVFSLSTARLNSSS